MTKMTKLEEILLNILKFKAYYGVLQYSVSCFGLVSQLFSAENFFRTFQKVRTES